MKYPSKCALECLAGRGGISIKSGFDESFRLRGIIARCGFALGCHAGSLLRSIDERHAELARIVSLAIAMLAPLLSPAAHLLPIANELFRR